MKTNEHIDFTPFIKDEPAGISLAFEHDSDGTVLTVGWEPNAELDADNQDLRGRDGLKYVEFTAGNREAAALIKLIVELGDQLRPIYEQLERTAVIACVGEQLEREAKKDAKWMLADETTAEEINDHFAKSGGAA